MRRRQCCFRKAEAMLNTSFRRLIIGRLLGRALSSAYRRALRRYNAWPFVTQPSCGGPRSYLIEEPWRQLWGLDSPSQIRPVYGRGIGAARLHRVISLADRVQRVVKVAGRSMACHHDYINKKYTPHREHIAERIKSKSSPTRR